MPFYLLLEHAHHSLKSLEIDAYNHMYAHRYGYSSDIETAMILLCNYKNLIVGNILIHAACLYKCLHNLDLILLYDFQYRTQIDTGIKNGFSRTWHLLRGLYTAV